MVPAVYLPMASLPLTPNGKVDRTALPVPVAAASEPQLESSASRLENDIAVVWKRVLHIDRAGLDENFFDLGGDSLLLVAVHSQLQKMLPIEIQVTHLFEFTTIRSLAQHFAKSAPLAPAFIPAQQHPQKHREAFARQRVVKGGRP